MQPTPTTVADLTGEALRQVFRHLSGKELAAAACTCKAWKEFLAGEEMLWQAACEAELGTSAPVNPSCQWQGVSRPALPSFRQAYSEWQRAYGQYGHLASRAWRAWLTLEAWLQREAPAIAHSLRPGASERELDEAELQLGMLLPPALRVLYRMHDGQELAFDASMDRGRAVMDQSIFDGLFGGYSFYSHLICMRFLPLKRLVRWTRTMQAQLGSPDTRSAVIFAANFNFRKLALCDTDSGQVLLPTADRATCIPGVPAQPGSSDGVLRWFEAYAQAVTAGVYAVEPLDPEYAPESTGICLFPRKAPGQAVAVTRGVQVAASPLFVPELTELDEEAGRTQHFFAYSVRFSLLSEEQQAEHWPATHGPFRPLQSVQLRSRHWVIRDASGGVESEVRGEAVVGHYPLLRPGAPDFVYQSCTHQRERSGSMEGDFRFVEGSLEQPSGAEFDVACPRFQLTVPEVIF